MTRGQQPACGQHRSPMSQIELGPGLADVPVAVSAVSFSVGRNARRLFIGLRLPEPPRLGTREGAGASPLGSASRDGPLCDRGAIIVDAEEGG